MMNENELPKLNLNFDDRAYYIKFRDAHGGYPIVYKGRQLFPDGWTYSLTDWAGPEWSPPEDPKELHNLQNAYWNSRWMRAINELRLVEAQHSTLVQLQSAKSAPLQVIVREMDEETGKMSTRTQDFNPKIFDAVVAWLKDEIETCDKEIKKLNPPAEEPVLNGVG